MRRGIVRRFERIVFILEMIIVVALVIGIIIGMTDLPYYFKSLIDSGGESYVIFESFLAYSLILIVGVELILMLLYHSTRAILELILFVIARKMLVYSHTMSDLVLGTLAILIVFIILRFLLPENHKHDIVRQVEKNYFPYMKMKDIFESWTEDTSHDPNMTLGDYIKANAVQNNIEIKEGTKINYRGFRIEVTSVFEDGEIQNVAIYDYSV